jgi:hypothetical protein
MWITGLALERILAEEARTKAEEELAAKRKEKGAKLISRTDMFGSERRALVAKVAADKEKGRARQLTNG